jgi:DNA-binding transcriptional MerR regulator
MYLTLEQAARELDRTERQVRYLVKTGILLPANQDTYKRDGGYRFSQEVIEKVKEKLKPEGISLRKAAEIVGITPQYLNSLALKGEIDSVLVMIGNKKERRFQMKDCLGFIEHFKNRTHKSVSQYGEKLHLYNHDLRLFELITYQGETVRIVKTEPVTFLNTKGELVSPAAVNVSPSLDWPEKAYKTKKGFIEFQVPMPRNAEHATYSILYKLIEGMGVKNVQIFERKDGDYFIRCRQGKLNIQRQYAELLKRYLVEGELTVINEEETLLQSNIVSQYIHLPRELYEEIEKIAKERSVSTQSQLVETVICGLNSFNSKD